jgi:hypothetical protein
MGGRLDDVERGLEPNSPDRVRLRSARIRGAACPILAPRLRCSGYAFNNADVSKIPTTATLDDDVLRAVKIKAARTGKRNSQVIEESLRRDLGLAELAEIWAKVTPAAEGEDMEVATDQLRAMRREKRHRRGTRPSAASSPCSLRPGCWAPPGGKGFRVGERRAPTRALKAAAGDLRCREGRSLGG